MNSGETHDVFFIFLAVFDSILLVVTMFVNFASTSVGITWGWFRNDTGEVSDFYYLEITPAGWTFSIWGFIYTFQVLFVIHLLTSLCRRVTLGPLYLHPRVITPAMLIIYAVNLALNSSWLFLWDRHVLVVALIVLALITFTLYVILFIHHRLVNKSGTNLRQNHRVDFLAIQIIIQNGMTLYATWVTIATLLNLAMVLTYWGGLDQAIASTISLSILLVEVLVYFVLENIVWDKYLRYTYTTWIVVIVALIGSISKNWNAASRNSIMSVVLLSLAGTLYLTKIILSILRAFKRPLYTNRASQPKQDLALE